MSIRDTIEYKKRIDDLYKEIEISKKYHMDYEDIENKLNNLLNFNGQELEEYVSNNITQFVYCYEDVENSLFKEERYRKLLIEILLNGGYVSDFVKIVGPNEISKNPELFNLSLERDLIGLIEHIDNFDKNNQLRILSEYENSERNFSSNTLDDFSDSAKKIIVCNKNMCKKIYDDLYLRFQPLNLNEECQSILWDNIKDVVKDESINEQFTVMNFFSSEDIKKQIVNDLNLIEYIYISNQQTVWSQENIKLVLENSNQEKIIEIILNQDIEDLFDFLEIMSYVSSENQLYILKKRPELLSLAPIRFGGIPFVRTLSYVDEKIRYDYIKENIDSIDFYYIMKLYDECNDNILIDLIVDNLLLKPVINKEFLYLYQNSFLNALTDEQQRLISEKLIWPSSFNFYNEGRDLTLDFDNSILGKKIISNIIKLLTTEPQINVISEVLLEIISKYCDLETKKTICEKIVWPNTIDNFNALKYEINDEILKEKVITNTLNLINSMNIMTSVPVSIVNNLKKIMNPVQMLLFYKKIDKSVLLSYALNEEYCDIVIEILKENPDYFSNINVVCKDYSRTLPLDKQNEILNILSEKQLLIYLSEICTMVPEIRKKYHQILMNNLDKITNCNQLELLSFDERDDYLKSISIPYLINMIGDSSEYIKKILEIRKEEIFEYLCHNAELLTIRKYFNYFNMEERKKLLDSLNFENLLYALILFDRLTEEETNYLIDQIVSTDAIEGTSLNNSVFSSLNVSTLKKLISKCNGYSLINLYSKTKLSSINEAVMNLLRNDITILGHPKCVNNFEAIMNLLDEESKTIIEKTINEMFESLDVDDNIKQVIKDNPLRCKISLVYAYNNGYLNDKKMEIFKELLNNNKFLLYSLDFRLLTDDILTMGSHFITKSSRYPEIVNMVSWLFEFKKTRGVLCKKIVNYLLENESKIVYDSEILIILDYICFNKGTKLDNIDLNNVSINDVIAYILEQKNDDNELVKYIDCDIKNYHNARIDACDNIMNSSNDIEFVRNAFFTRYFWLSTKEIDNFLISYAYGYDDVVKSYADDMLPIDYINSIFKIKNIEDVNTLKEIYKKGFIEYSINDYMSIVGKMKEAYNKTFEVECKNKNSSMITTNTEISTVEQKIEVIEMLDNFGLFIHSTDAYGNMPMINDNYFDSWNNNTNTANHGICSCYITNKSFGMPPVKNNGVLFGFTNINATSVNMMAPYDLMTINKGYNITSFRNPMYLRLDNTSDFTRHTHNEFNLERRNRNGDYPCTEPDCVVILSTMSDEIKQNSLKAVEDFKTQGIDLKIYYIDIHKLLNNEANKNNEIIKEYLQTKNISFLKDIINNYESLRCCSDFISDINIGEILNKDSIYDLLISSSIELLQSNDLDAIKQFIDIMDNEQMKFTVIEECVGARAHSFDLLTPDIENNIELLRLKIRKGGLNKELGRKINT